MLRSRALCTTGIAGILTAILTALGCTHIHNDHYAQVSKDISTQFETYRKPSTSIYDTMIENHKRVEARLSEHQRQLGALRTKAFLNQLNTATWADIHKRLVDNQQSRDTLNDLIQDRLKTILVERDRSAKDIVDAKSALQKAQELVKRATQDELKWKARQLLFQGTIKLVIEKGKIDTTTFNSIKTDVLKQEVPGEEQKPDGSAITVEDALQDDLTAFQHLDFATVLKSYTYGLLDPNAAPGIQITILSLGSDLADARLKRAQTERDYLDTQIKLLGASIQEANVQRVGIARLEDWLNDPRPALRFSAQKTPLETINYFRKPFARNDDALGRADAIKAALGIVAVYAVSATIDDPTNNKLELDARLASTEHDYSIRTSAINAAEQEALIGRGLQALVAYHAGGITAEEMANLIGAAQTIALAVIGVGVN
jgi:hypothetical protein